MDAAVSSDPDAPKNGYGMYTTEFRALDVRLGRWFSPDPITQPSQSPYCSMDNNPIWLTDVMGLIAEGEGGGSVGSDAPGQGGSATNAGGDFDYSNPGDIGNVGAGAATSGGAGANPASINAAVCAVSNPANVSGAAFNVGLPKRAPFTGAPATTSPTATTRPAKKTNNTIGYTVGVLSQSQTDVVVDYPNWYEIVLSENAATVAKSILLNKNITLGNAHYSPTKGYKKDDKANADDNIKDVAKSKKGWTSPYSQVRSTQQDINFNLLKGLGQLSKNNTFRISEILGGKHSKATSKHYTGNAVDINVVNGVRVRNMTEEAVNEFRKAAYKGGAKKVLDPVTDKSGGHWNHFHIVW